MGEVNLYCDDCRQSTTGRCPAHSTFTIPAGALKVGDPMPWGQPQAAQAPAPTAAEWADVCGQLVRLSAELAHANRTNVRLERELAEAKQALADRKVIERAKGMLQEAHGLTEREAYAFLRKRSQDQGTPICEIAAAVIVVHGTPAKHVGRRELVEAALTMERTVPAPGGVEGENDAAGESDAGYADA